MERIKDDATVLTISTILKLIEISYDTDNY